MLASRSAEDRYRLPNGLEIAYQTRAEADFFYDDIFVERAYHRNGIVLRPGATFVDVGGNIGLTTLYLHYHCPGARIFVFEPVPQLFARLRTNVALHRVQARCFNVGLGAREEECTFTFYPNSSGMSSLYADRAEEAAALRAVIANQHAQGRPELNDVMAHVDDLIDERLHEEVITCRLRRLSNVIAEAGIETIDLLKVDVQKAELDVLRGIDPAHWARIQQVVLEVHDRDGVLEAINALLAEHGFESIVEQDTHYIDSPIYNIYAARPGYPASQAEPVSAGAQAAARAHQRAQHQRRARRHLHHRTDHPD